VEQSFKSRVLIRPPTLHDWAAFQLAVRRSRTLHDPWGAPPYSRTQFETYLRRATSDSHRGFLIAPGLRCNRRSRQSGKYYSWSAARCLHWLLRLCPHAGEGLMREGMKLVLKHVFQKLRLHRLEANIQPKNRASIRLARSCGFVREGFSRRYLKVNGRWQDHERWALLSENFPSRKLK